MTDTQTQLREKVDHYLDTQLIEHLSIRDELQEVTAPGDKDRSYLSTGKLRVEIILAPK